jgi:GT2 family glycosyltransferase
MTLDVTVIICTHDLARWDDLQAAVASVRAQTAPPHEIIVVVDHQPKLLRWATETFDGVTVIENSGPPGLSGARNTGVAASTSAFLAFMDDDAVAAADWLATLCTPLAEAVALGGGGAIVPRWLGRHPRWLPEEFYWVVGCTYRGMPERQAPIRNPIGANMCLQSAPFHTVGGFHIDIGRKGYLPLGCEETEWCIRAAQQWPQHPFLYVPDARVFHRVPPERTRWNYFVRRCYAEGISKAAISRLRGARTALSTERSYVWRTLPQGIARGIGSTVRHRDWSGLARAGAIVAGLAFTTAGYVIGRLSERHITVEVSKP